MCVVDIKKGFYIYAFGKDCFMESDSKNRTDRLACEFLNKLQASVNCFYDITPDCLARFKEAIRPAKMEVNIIERGKFTGLKYIVFTGENFSVGTDASTNPYESCIIV